jgi:FSR family fosmidomycin resistance protein-like MFS transporter
VRRLIAAISSLAVLGQLIDLTNIQFVFQLCGFLPLLGLLAAFLPDVERKRAT